MSGICTPWLDIEADLCLPPAAAADPATINAVAEAEQWVFHATGSRYTGECTSTLRIAMPCGHEHCSCRPRWRRVDLSVFVPGPVSSIVEVVVDGEEVDESLYRLVNGRWFTPHGGEEVDNPLRPWPTQHLNRPDGDEGTWSVTVTHGAAPPAPLVGAAAELARQLIAKCSGGECDLPDNATSISKDGVTVSLQVPTDGSTGLAMVDSKIALYRSAPRRRLLDPAGPVAEVIRGV